MDPTLLILAEVPCAGSYVGNQAPSPRDPLVSPPSCQRVVRFGTRGAFSAAMTHSKRSVSRSDSLSPFATFIREHDQDDGSTLHPLSSSAVLAASIDEGEAFVERWVACHFSLSVKLHDVRRELSRKEDGDGGVLKDKELEAIVEDLDVVQGVM